MVAVGSAVVAVAAVGSAVGSAAAAVAAVGSVAVAVAVDCVVVDPSFCLYFVYS